MGSTVCLTTHQRTFERAIREHSRARKQEHYTVNNLDASPTLGHLLLSVVMEVPWLPMVQPCPCVAPLPHGKGGAAMLCMLLVPSLGDIVGVT